MARRTWMSRARHQHDGTMQREALRSVPSFSACTRAELAVVDAATYEITLAPGVVLAVEDERPSQVVFVVDGTLVGTVGDEIVAWWRRGACVCGYEVFARRANTMTVSTASTVKARVASVREYLGLVAQVPGLAPAIPVLSTARADDAVAAHAGARVGAVE